MAKGFSAKTKPRQFTSWSNSRWNDYAQCPARAKYKHLDKLPEPKSAPMARGIEIALIEEGFFKGDIKTLPVWPRRDKVTSPPGEFPKWDGNLAKAKKNGLAIHPAIAPLMVAAKKQKSLMVEQDWAFRKDWSLTTWNDWTGCWLRVKIDVCWEEDGDTLIIVDNKTGKYSDYDVEKYLEQLRLYAAAGAARFPHIKTFKVRLWFTDLGIQYPENEFMEITRAEALKLQKKFTKQVQPMFNDTRFDPTPNRGCHWCHFSKANGGPCKY